MVTYPSSLNFDRDRNGAVTYEEFRITFLENTKQHYTKNDGTLNYKKFSNYISNGFGKLGTDYARWIDAQSPWDSKKSLGKNQRNEKLDELEMKDFHQHWIGVEDYYTKEKKSYTRKDNITALSDIVSFHIFHELSQRVMHSQGLPIAPWRQDTQTRERIENKFFETLATYEDKGITAGEWGAGFKSNENYYS